MSLLQNEDFVLYQLRTSYLNSIKDGVGERLININSSVLNNPAFRAAGWVQTGSDIKRTYSPPIPTAIASDYFQVPPRSAGLTGPNTGDDDEEGGMVTGVGSNETLGPTLNARRRKRKEQIREEDSSDLSDESDDEPDVPQRAVSQIKFSKMPVRARADSSPLRSSGTRDGPSLLVTSPSRPPDSHQLRRGSLGTLDTTRGRPRRDTVTSSEMSSENELDPSVFKRKQLNPPRAHRSGRMIAEDIQEEKSEIEDVDRDGESSNDSELSSEFGGSAESNSLLGEHDAPMASPITSDGPHLLQRMTPQGVSPRKTKQAPQVLQALPPPRPISTIQPKSALSMALKGKDKSDDPLARFAIHSGKGENNSLNIRIYAPFSSNPTKPFELLLKRMTSDGGPVIVADAIGIALWRYGQEQFEPQLAPAKADVNRWTMRMVEDEEVDMDFPALSRAKPVLDFTSNNNRAAQGRFRGTPWDEFALVEATEREYQQNKSVTPFHSNKAESPQAKREEPSKAQAGPKTQAAPPPTIQPAALVRGNPITGRSFNPAAARKDGTTLFDTPQTNLPHSTPRTGESKILTVHFIDDHLNPRVTALEATTDTYLAEVFDSVCKKMNVDKGLFVLKVHNTNTVAASDRTVEALGDRTDLDLARRRFVGDGAFGLSGSPGSSSPNAPLFIPNPMPPPISNKKGKKAAAAQMQMQMQQQQQQHPLAQKQDAFALANAVGTFKRWHVLRKTPMSFSSSSPRVIALDGDFMYIMSNEGTGAGGGGGGGGAGGRAGAADAAAGAKSTRLEAAPTKTTTVHLSSIIGCKVSRRHPRTFRVIVFKERQPKRYDFEAPTQAIAAEIVTEVKSMADQGGAAI